MTPQEQPNTKCICGKPDCDIPYGLCHCGCLHKTPIAKMNRYKIGHLKGRPTPRIGGHRGSPDRFTFVPVETFEVDGDQCRAIPLTMGKFAIILANQYDELSKLIWFAHFCHGDYYAVRKKEVNGKRVRVFMHREIMGAARTSFGDHRNGNTLDNRPRNLRPATRSENCRNRKKNKNNTSGYKGVSLNRKTGKYIATIFLNGKNRSLGSFVDPKDAHAAYCAAAKLHYGEFARFE